jgi:hypothetical protein
MKVDAATWLRIYGCSSCTGHSVPIVPRSELLLNRDSQEIDRRPPFTLLQEGIETELKALVIVVGGGFHVGESLGSRPLRGEAEDEFRDGCRRLLDNRRCSIGQRRPMLPRDFNEHSLFVGAEDPDHAKPVEFVKFGLDGAPGQAGGIGDLLDRSADLVVRSGGRYVVKDCDNLVGVMPR